VAFERDSFDKDKINNKGRDELSFNLEGARAVNCYILNPIFTSHHPLNANANNDSNHYYERTPEDQKEEITGLCESIQLDIKAYQDVRLSAPKPSTLFGKGKLSEIHDLLEGLHVEVVIVNSALTPIQQRNLENLLGVKILDRTGLILEIFGRRAQTKEGRLQVELAHLTYQKGRLVALGAVMDSP